MPTSPQAAARKARYRERQRVKAALVAEIAHAPTVRQARELAAAAMARAPDPRVIAVQTPAGRFASMADAARHHGISRQAVHGKVARCVPGWKKIDLRHEKDVDGVRERE
jgi:hypothetical protein